MSTFIDGPDTLTSQRLDFRALPLCRRLLRRRVTFPALVAPLISRIGEPMARGLLELATTDAAVALPSVVRSTNAEPREASPATEDEDLELVVHPSRRDGRKLDSGFRANDSTRVLLPIHQLYMRGSGCYLVPSLRLATAARNYTNTASRATS